MTNQLPVALSNEIQKLEKLMGRDIFICYGALNGDDKSELGGYEDGVFLQKMSNEYEKEHDKVCLLLRTNGGCFNRGIELVNLIRDKYGVHSNPAQAVSFEDVLSTGTFVAFCMDEFFLSSVNGKISDFNSVASPVLPKIEDMRKRTEQYVNYITSYFQSGILAYRSEDNIFAILFLFSSLYSMSSVSHSVWQFEEAKKLIDEIRDAHSHKYAQELDELHQSIVKFMEANNVSKVIAAQNFQLVI